MKPIRARFILPLLAVLLLTGALAGSAAAQTSAPVTPAASSASPDWMLPTCTKNATLSVAGLLPQPQFMSPLCGSCSAPACRGVTEFTLCGGGLNPPRCVAGDTCSDNTPQCTCQGRLPNN